MILTTPARSSALPRIALLLGTALTTMASLAEPFIAPGRTDLRVDLQTLADAGIVTGTTTSWPISWQSIISDIEDANVALLSPAQRDAYARVRAETRLVDQMHRLLPHVRLGGSSQPAGLRSFSGRPRAEGEFEGGISYTGDRLSFNIDVTRAINSDDDWRLDGSYVGFAVGNWAVLAGYPERWWGPGMQGSLILSTNARPIPQIGIERISTAGFTSRWLRWLGPWTVSSFIGELDDAREVRHAKLFGLRFTARPLPQLEIAFSRTSQLCGDGRPCGAEEFGNMLIGRDNRGVNISADAEPGNQLAGIDGRWAFADRRFAFYWQWIGEDSRQGGPQIGNWLRMIGSEHTGPVGHSGWNHRTFLEIADTTCQQGGIGFGGNLFNCGYEHSIYRSGYRYQGLPIGYATDADSESLSIVSVLTGSGTASWELGAHSVRVNQGPASGQPHSLSPSRASRYGVEVAHVRDLPVGRLRLRLSAFEQKDSLTGRSESDTALAAEWLIGYW